MFDRPAPPPAPVRIADRPKPRLLGAQFRITYFPAIRPVEVCPLTHPQAGRGLFSWWGSRVGDGRRRRLLLAALGTGIDDNEYCDDDRECSKCTCGP